jgi:hypothetical protein
MWVEVGRARLKPDFFIYLVKPKPKSDLSPTYLVMFSSLQKTKARSLKPEPDLRLQKSGPTHL